MKLRPQPVRLSSRLCRADHRHLAPEVRERDGGRDGASPVLLHHHREGHQRPRGPVELRGEILQRPQAGSLPPTRHDTAGKRRRTDDAIMSWNNNIHTKDGVDPICRCDAALLYADDTVLYYTT